MLRAVTDQQLGLAGLRPSLRRILDLQAFSAPAASGSRRRDWRQDVMRAVRMAVSTGE